MSCTSMMLLPAESVVLMPEDLRWNLISTKLGVIVFAADARKVLDLASHDRCWSCHIRTGYFDVRINWIGNIKADKTLWNQYDFVFFDLNKSNLIGQTCYIFVLSTTADTPARLPMLPNPWSRECRCIAFFFHKCTSSLPGKHKCVRGLHVCTWESERGQNAQLRNRWRRLHFHAYNTFRLTLSNMQMLGLLPILKVQSKSNP